MTLKRTQTEIAFDVDQFLPGISVDCVILGYDENQLKALVLRWKGGDIWSLPGGLVLKEEDMDKSAIRVLRERAGIDIPFLEQFKVFGKNGRRDKSNLNLNIGSLGVSEKIKNWFKNRFVTVGYVSLIDISQCNPKLDAMSDRIEWVPIDELPPLIYDHREIILEAIKHIRHKINYLPVGENLLPEKFTMKELQGLYESILEKKLDRGNFQRKMLRLNFLIRHEKQMEGGAHKAPYLYSFDREKYKAILDKGIGFVS
jgi:ADP-ribose pyrophosphatase YjhB (NUDIX family)